MRLHRNGEYKNMPMGIYKRTKGIGGWNGKKGRVFSDKHRKKLSENSSHYWLGKKNYKQIEKMKDKSSWNKGLTGEKSHSWQNGISFEPYGIEFNNELREKIRKRDNYTCQLTGEKQGNRKLTIHHIDYDKKNNVENNLISLSGSSNAKVNFNREYWFKYFRRQCLT